LQPETLKIPRPRLKTVIRLVVIALVCAVIYNGFFQEMPPQTSFEGKLGEVDSIEFISDLTYIKGEGQVVREQEIFNRILKEIQEAEDFIILDMFLFNDDYEKTQYFPPLAHRLTQALIEKKAHVPGIEIIFITDPMNNLYASYPSKYFELLEDNGVQLVLTDLNEMREPNPLYAGFWRTFVMWTGMGDDGWIQNPFSPDSPPVTLRAYLKLLNFKANHRKVLITEKSAVVTSANPHDASAYHSNIAFIVKGEVINDLIAAENAVVMFSGQEPINGCKYKGSTKSMGVGTRVAVLTEGKIGKTLLEEIKGTQQGDEIKMAMFYLSERSIVKEFLEAAGRGADIKIILDPNKDAFGREKNGIPNRQVAYELVTRSGGKIKVRWYDTHGEQFHTKMLILNAGGKTTIFGGSANFTRRNLGDYNLETDLKLEVPMGEALVSDINGYFDKIWFNEGGSYTTDFEKYEENSKWKWMLYRFQEWSGISTF
jgi:phosphatidylserine/phosphatidylglycerophosphate/cardiolipin synthase-like enzyme